MHTIQKHGWSISFNSDFSGGVGFVCEGRGLVIPFEVLAAVVAEAVRRQKIADLEQESDAEVLGLRGGELARGRFR